MADFEKNLNEEEIGELDDIIYTLTEEETGEEKDFQLIAQATIDDVLYYALLPLDEEGDEYVILRVTEEGEDVVFDTIDDDDEFEKVEEYFNDLLFGEVDYDEE